MIVDRLPNWMLRKPSKYDESMITRAEDEKKAGETAEREKASWIPKERRVSKTKKEKEEETE